MTEEQKQLLLKDLCARLPYGVIVYYPDCYGDGWDEVISVNKDEVQVLYNGTTVPIEICKPYLRPLSSMTEEEYKEYKGWKDGVYNDPAIQSGGYFVWLNAHHLDFQGLIPKGLALEAPEGMYKTE